MRNKFRKIVRECLKKPKQEHNTQVMGGEENIHAIGWWNWLTTIILTVLIGLCVVFAAQIMSKGYASVNGYSLFRVVTGSMEPAISSGAILISKRVPIDEIQTGDVICYSSFAADIFGATVTHRVIGVERDVSGRILLETRGDANNASDPYFVEETNLIGKVVWYHNKAEGITKMLAFLGGDIGFLACIVFPILLIAGLIMQRAVNNIQTEIKTAVKIGAGSPPKQLVKGFQTITEEEYEEIYNSLKEELIREYLKNQDIKNDSEANHLE